MKNSKVAVKLIKVQTKKNQEFFIYQYKIH